jgi:hypothetical protein
MSLNKNFLPNEVKALLISFLLLHNSKESTSQYYAFIKFRGGGVRLSPLGTSASKWSIAPAPDDI